MYSTARFSDRRAKTSKNLAIAVLPKNAFAVINIGFDDLVMLAACGLHNFRISLKTNALLF